MLPLGLLLIRTLPIAHAKDLMCNTTIPGIKRTGQLHGVYLQIGADVKNPLVFVKPCAVVLHVGVVYT